MYGNVFDDFLGVAVDMWSIGVIIFTLLRGGLPFDGDNEKGTRVYIYMNVLGNEISLIISYLIFY